MWGNRLGWLISAILLLAVATVIAATFIVSSRRTEPTAFSRDPANLAAIELPIDPHTLLPEPQRNDDAGDLYWQAYVDHRDHRESYDREADIASFNVNRATELVGIKAAMDAAAYQRASIFTKRVDAAVGYGPTPAVTALQQIGTILARIGTQYADLQKYSDAKRYLRAEFILGLRLYEERMTLQQLSVSLGLMAHAATTLSQIAVDEDDKALAFRLKDYLKAQRDYSTGHIEPIARVITSIDPSVQSQYVGDIFVFARNSAERTWRVESTLKLGMYKYHTTTLGDRRAAIREVRELLTDPDPAVSAAALCARELTRETYRTLGSK